MHDPRSPDRAGSRDGALVQTIDLAPTLLDFFGAGPTPDMQGRPLRETTTASQPRESALFGMFGGHVNVTDGRYVYMRACHDDTNRPLYEHTLMPTRIRGRFTPAELSDLSLAEPFGFTKGVRTLRIEANPSPLLGPQRFGSLLFDLATDPHQEKPLVDDTVELRMIRLLVERLRASEAPADQYARLGLPHDPEEVDEAHLLVAAQRERAETAREPAARSDEFTEGALGVRTPLARLLAEPAATEAIRRIVPGLLDTELLTVRGAGSLLQIAAFAGHPGRAQLAALADELARLFPLPPTHHDGASSR